MDLATCLKKMELVGVLAFATVFQAAMCHTIQQDFMEVSMTSTTMELT